MSKTGCGNAGVDATADHLEVLTTAIAQVPAGHRKKLLVRQIGFLEARHRAHARVWGASRLREDRIRVAKDSGLGRFPSANTRSTPPG